MEIIEADDYYRDILNKFYCEQGYHSGWSHTERAFIAINNNDIIGSVKVEVRDGVSILRGMYIIKEYQGKALGTSFIKFIEPILNETVSYCMPFMHLNEFYGQIDFKPINPTCLPTFLAQRYQSYKDRGYQIIAMCREQV